MSVPSEVVDDLDIKCIASMPAETEPPLVIDTNAMLSPAIALERFHPIPRGASQISETDGTVEIQELAPRNSFNLTKSLDTTIVE